MTGGELCGKLAGAPRSAAWATDTLTAMLDRAHRDHWELFDLVARRLAQRHKLALTEYMAALAARRPVIDKLIHRPRGKQRPTVTLMAGLPTRFAPRPVLATPRRPPRRISARRPRGVLRILGQLALELLHPRLQLLDTPVHSQKDFDYRLAPRVIDRLRLNALHTPIFDEAELCPPTH
jgi:hypothetical protein